LNPTVTTRFAPSPTGFLHLGHAYAAIMAHDLARAENGRFCLRIEDIDQGRCRPEFEAVIVEDLAWLGLAWDGPVIRQSERLAAYRAALDRLAQAGLVYPCFCTRAGIAAEISRMASAPHGAAAPAYPGTCRALPAGARARRMAAGEAFAWRLDVAAAQARTGPAQLGFLETGRGPEDQTGQIAARPEIAGDVVLGRKDSGVSYQLACVVDDAEQGVTLVSRGDDLFAATHTQRLLQALLGLPAPAYHHHRLICDPAGRRLAKRDGDQTLRALRGAGETPAGIRARLGLPVQP
jgi:glutamyl-Q tRNA(Asp) synthetase